jgi:hypothetical protein
MPITAEQDSAAVVAVVYRNSNDDRMRLRQITDRCGIQPPMVIAVDYNRFFDKRREQMLS